MKKVGIALLGLGTVGGGTYKILEKNHEAFKKYEGLDIEVLHVLERNMKRVEELGVNPDIVSTDIDNVVNNKDISIVCEFFGGIEPARTFLIKALEAGKSIVTFHEAFDYYAAEFDLTVAAVVQHEEGDAPSAREIAETVRIIREKGVCALFAEPQYTDESINLIARETGLPVYLLDPVVSGEADPDDADAYLRIMRRNLATLLEALK